MPESVAVVPFGLLAAAALGGAVAAVLSRDAARAVFWLVETMVAVAGLLLLLSAEYLAVVHLVVLAGALPACALLTVMAAAPSRRGARGSWRSVAIAAVWALSLGAAAVGAILALRPETARAPAVALGAAELGLTLFTRWSLPLEIAAVVLLAVLVGAASRPGGEPEE